MNDNLTKTKEAMKGAPRHSFYVWPDKALAIPRALAKELKRSDLTIVAPNFFGRKGRGAGMRVKIVIDPMCAFSVGQHCDIDKCRIAE